MKIIKQDITQLKDVDVLVNSIATNDKELGKCGALSAAFAKAGGNEFVESVQKKLPLKEGELFSTCPGNLHCKLVLNVRISQWRENETEKILLSIINKCISETAKHDFKSIAFPIFGSGNLKYPVEVVGNCFSGAYKTARKNKHNIEVFALSVSGGAVNQLRRYWQNRTVVAAIKDPGIRYMNERQRKQVKEMAEKLDKIDIDMEKGTIFLHGNCSKVRESGGKIQEIVSNSVCAYNLKDSTQLEEYAMRPARLPRSWSNCPGEQLPEACRKLGDDCLTEEIKGDALKDIKHLVHSLWEKDQALIGAGKDALGISHSHIEVKEVQRIENSRLYREYSRTRKAFCEKAALEECLPLDGRQGEDETLTYNTDYKLNKDLISEINERYLFHGTKMDYLQAVCQQGLDSRVSSTGLFGYGFYLAEHPMKSDQYADWRDERRSKGLVMLLVKAILGNVYVSQEASPDRRRPPCLECETDNCLEHGKLFDTVMGVGRDEDTRLLFREYIIYDQARCYPEYIIHYDRIGGDYEDEYEVFDLESEEADDFSDDSESA